MRKGRLFTTAFALQMILVGAALLASLPASGAEAIWRLDCGTEDSPVMEGYRRLAAIDHYDESRGYGWETSSARGVVFTKPIPPAKMKNMDGVKFMSLVFNEYLNALNGDAVVSEDDLVFRCDVPDGLYRVRVTVGDMTQAIGSMDIHINGELVGEHVAAWTPGGYRRIDYVPFGWRNTVRATVKAKNGAIRIALTKNQSYYDQQLAIQAEGPNPYKRWPHKTPMRQEPPYHFIGFPFIHNSVQAVEIEPYRPAVVVGENEKLRLTQAVDSPALHRAIEKFNAGDYKASLASLREVNEGNAAPAKAIVSLWLAGRLEIEEERTLVPQALKTLRVYAAENPDDYAVGEILADAELFRKAHLLHLNRGGIGINHFYENSKAAGHWWLIQEDSPLYYKAQLHCGRALHQLMPYFPCIGTIGEIFKKLEKKFPDNRFVKYRLHGPGIYAKDLPGRYGDWEPYGDGSDYYDWVMVDYDAKTKDAPEWVRAIYPAYAWLVDLSEWWITYRQEPEGTIGGGWGDDVEIVGLFGYYGYISKGVSDLCLQGTRNLVDGVWNRSAVDPELGYCLPNADAEHTAEWTGNTLGMMVQIDYGKPAWIERSMKTARLIRDVWTDYNDKGRRHFRANFFGAAQVGSGNQMNDSWINYRGVRPATAVWWYNRSPAVAELYTELADAWVADAMSTERGKPKGVIPAEVSFPEGAIGGKNSPNWHTSTHTEGTVNYDWKGQRYKDYVADILMIAYRHTNDIKYAEPLKMEYELALKYGHTLDPLENKRSSGPRKVNTTAKPGSEEWAAAWVNTNHWVEFERMVKGREGKLEDYRTKADIIETGAYVVQQLKWRWPLMTSEAGPTDRVAFGGIVDPFFIYTGGGFGGPLLRAAVTYENTTKDFAAAVLANDPQGLRIIYYSLTNDTRTIGIVPWELEPAGKYRLAYGPDANEDHVRDSITEERDFHWPQPGTPVYLDIEPRMTYIIDIDQLERGRSVELAPDPALSAEDIRWSGGRLLARIHNVGSKAVRNVVVAAYDGDPKNGGTLIGKGRIPNIEAPLDLEPRTTTIGFNWSPSKEAHEIYVVVDPDDTIKNEISTFNNAAHATLKRDEGGQTPKPASTSRRR